jgi:serine/threonine protein kinase
LSELTPFSASDLEIRGPIGSGAMASVFEAVWKKTGELVAVKRLEGSARESCEARERMVREAALLASVQSPHVARLLGHGSDDGQPFVVLERLHGETLSDCLRREGRLGVAHLAEWVEQLLIGVRDCHRASIIHRDIKPANVFLAAPTDGQGEAVVKLIDLGVARLDANVSEGAGLTGTRHLIGSVAYMAPEQLESPRDAGPAADVYAVGVVVFRCVTGRLPFVGAGVDALVKAKFSSTPPRLFSRSAVAAVAPLEAFVARALSPDPKARFPNGGAMLEEWWRVAAALEHEIAATDIAADGDVVLHEEEWISTLVESRAQTDSRPLETSPDPLPSGTLDEEVTAAEPQPPADAPPSKGD